MATNNARSLHEENVRPIGIYILVHSVVFCALTFGLALNAGLGSLLDKLFASGVFIAVLGLLTTWINGQVNPHWKAVLVFWRLSDPLPGCRIFSILMHRESRIDPAVLASRYGILPDEPKQQNCLWYQIYKKHREKQPIKEVHRKFLLMRDLTSLSVGFFPILVSANFFVLRNHQTSAVYCFCLIGLWLMLRQAAKNYGTSFALDVLAEDMPTTKERELC